jgi:hypothetical protein
MDTPVQPTREVSNVPSPGAVWVKSSYSGTQGNCVEVATNLPGKVAVRDSKDPEGGVLRLSREAWMAFLSHLK